MTTNPSPPAAAPYFALQRCNVAGSIRFKKLIVENNWAKGAEIAAKQVGNCRQTAGL